LSAASRVLLSLGLVLLAPGGPQLGGSVHAQLQARAGYEEGMERLNSVLEGVAQLRTTLIDRSRIDLTELGLDMAFEDAETIAGWVRENIAFQPYRGVLRGAQGTLLSASGNALDQALLLSGLLSDAGYEVRIARGELGDAAAASLLAVARNADFGVDVGQLLEQAAPIIAEFERTAGVPAGTITADLQHALEGSQVQGGLLEEARDGTRLILEVAAQAGLESGPQPVDEQLLAEARDYAWVEYRLSGAQEWQPLHTAFDPPETPEAHGYIDGLVPDELLHQVRIEVTIERKVGDVLEIEPVMEPWQAPLANLTDTVITYSNAPSSVADGLASGVPHTISQAQHFLPQLNGSLAPGAMAFDTEGVLLAPMFASHDASGLFRETNRGFQAATSLLGVLGTEEEPDDPLALTAQWINITLIAPDGQERTHQRTVFDLIGPEARAAGETFVPTGMSDQVTVSLITDQRMMAITGDVNPLQILDEFLGRFLETRPLLEHMLALSYGVEPQSPLEDVFAEPSALEHLLTAQLFDAALPGGEERLAYRAQPTFLIFSESLHGDFDDTVQRSSLDIVENPRRVIDRSSGGYLLDRQANAYMGVWETIVERELLDSQGTGWNTTRVVAGALASGAALQVVTAPEQLDGLGLTDEAHFNLQRDLDAGYVAILPSQFDEPQKAAWWRLHPDTGEVLGITADGRGQIATEYSVQLADNVSTMLFALLSMDNCMKSTASGSLAQMCCMLRAHVNNVTGLSMGGMLSAGFGGGLTGAVASLSLTLASAAVDTDYTGMTC